LSYSFYLRDMLAEVKEICYFFKFSTSRLEFLDAIKRFLLFLYVFVVKFFFRDFFLICQLFEICI